MIREFSVVFDDNRRFQGAVDRTLAFIADDEKTVEESVSFDKVCALRLETFLWGLLREKQNEDLLLAAAQRRVTLDADLSALCQKLGVETIDEKVRSDATPGPLD